MSSEQNTILDDHLSNKPIRLNDKAIIKTEKRLIGAIIGLVIVLTILFLSELNLNIRLYHQLLDFSIILAISLVPLIFIYIWRAFREKISKSIPIGIILYSFLTIGLLGSYAVSLLEILFSSIRIFFIFSDLENNATFRHIYTSLFFFFAILVSLYQLYVCTYLVITFIKFRKSKQNTI